MLARKTVHTVIYTDPTTEHRRGDRLVACGLHIPKEQNMKRLLGLLLVVGCGGPPD